MACAAASPYSGPLAPHSWWSAQHGASSISCAMSWVCHWGLLPAGERETNSAGVCLCHVANSVQTCPECPFVCLFPTVGCVPVDQTSLGPLSCGCFCANLPCVLGCAAVRPNAFKHGHAGGGHGHDTSIMLKVIVTSVHGMQLNFWGNYLVTLIRLTQQLVFQPRMGGSTHALRRAWTLSPPIRLSLYVSDAASRLTRAIKLPCGSSVRCMIHRGRYTRSRR